MPPSLVMSENYIVFVEQPIKIDLLKFMLYKIQGKSFSKVMTWEPQHATIFHLVNRHTGKVTYIITLIYCIQSRVKQETHNHNQLPRSRNRKKKESCKLISSCTITFFSYLFLMKLHSDGVAFPRVLLLSIFSSHYTAYPLSI